MILAAIHASALQIPGSHFFQRMAEQESNTFSSHLCSDNWGNLQGLTLVVQVRKKQ